MGKYLKLKSYFLNGKVETSQTWVDFFWTINLKEKGTSELDNYKVGLKYDMFGNIWSGVKSQMAEVSP